jgi:hypothetical protein
MIAATSARASSVTGGQSTTVYTATFKKLGVEHPRQVEHPAIDCFLRLPTVSD